MKSKGSGILWPVLLVILFLLSGKISQVWYSWFPVGAEYGYAYNEVRKKLGVLELPQDWTTNNHSDEFKTWKPRVVSGVRTMKTIRLENDLIITEIDYLKNGEYTMQIQYSYLFESPWEIKIQYGENDLMLSKSQSDSVLTVWGIK
tara:strand:+ start:206 stop:643 length:438 start_codon:yes stop_codon:yes gene_type:complete